MKLPNMICIYIVKDGFLRSFNYARNDKAKTIEATSGFLLSETKTSSLKITPYYHHAWK